MRGDERGVVDCEGTLQVAARVAFGKSRDVLTLRSPFETGAAYSSAHSESEDMSGASAESLRAAAFACVRPGGG